MKTSFLLLGLVWLAPLQGADPAPGAPPAMVELKACFVRTTEEQFRGALKASSVTDENASLLDGENLGKVLAALQTEKASFLADLRTVTLSGSEAVIASVREFRYPTEFEKSAAGPDKMVPVSFETRNVGITVTFNAEIRLPGQITLTVRPEVTDFLGFIDYSGTGAPSTSDELTLEERLKAPLTPGGIWQPLFSSANLLARASLTSGQTIVLGGTPDPSVKGLDATKTGPKDGGKKDRIYVFVTAILLKDN